MSLFIRTIDLSGATPRSARPSLVYNMQEWSG
jgi:hypothetical protein